jgi:ABC-2 type transport system ATP-binding protein
MIELVRLHKRFGDTDAVAKLSLEVGAGEVFGFLGPNGAGKTTTIRMMMGLLQPTSGRIRLGGHDLLVRPEEAKRLCGFVPDRPHVYEKLSAREFLEFVAGLYHVPGREVRARTEELLELFDLTAVADDLMESFSHGMKQRAALAAALVHAPRILVLDEPMVGMDPRGARLLKATFRQLAASGVCVFVSTHSLDVAEETCDRIGVIHRGRLAAVGTLDELRRAAGGDATMRLETVFLRLTGEAGAKPADDRAPRAAEAAG